MVSLRRKKFKEMTEGRPRRSSRLVALEELDNEKAILALPVNLEQMKGNGHLNLRKRGRKKEAQISHDIDENINGNSMNSLPTVRKATDRIIGYILDMLEVKDTHELFSMPDNLQMHNYQESMSKPGDFATLRQKQTDGMYMTLEQFENDVLTVFQKAIDSNSRDSIPFREAITLRDHARQIFQSLKNNLPYAELELSTWHRKYFNYKRRPQRNVSYAGTSTNFPRPKYKSDLAVPTEMKRSTGAPNLAACGRQYSMNMKEHSQPRDSSILTGKRGYYYPVAVSREDKHPLSLEEQQKCTAHKPWSDSNEFLFTTFCREPKPLLSNNTLSYQESLRLFVKDAGPVAKLVGERKCLEYSKRVQAQSIWKPTPFGSHSKLGDQPFCSPPTPPQNFRGSTTNSSSFSTDTTSQISDKVVKTTTTCKLQTDELLNLVSLIGTPEFLQRSMSSSKNQDVGSEWGCSSLLQGMFATNSSISSTKQIGQFSNFKLEVPKHPTVDLSLIWQPRFGGSKPRKERGSAESSFASGSNCSFQSKRDNFNGRHGPK